MLRFSKEKCKKDLESFFHVKILNDDSVKWIDENDGKIVVNGEIKGTKRAVCKEWCIEVPDEEKKPN